MANVYVEITEGKVSAMWADAPVGPFIIYVTQPDVVQFEETGHTVVYRDTITEPQTFDPIAENWTSYYPF